LIADPRIKEYAVAGHGNRRQKKERKTTILWTIWAVGEVPSKIICFRKRSFGCLYVSSRYRHDMIKVLCGHLARHQEKLGHVVVRRKKKQARVAAAVPAEKTRAAMDRL